MPQARQQSEADRTVQLTSVKNGKPVTLVMGKQARAVDNLWVLSLTIEAMRLNEKRRIAEVADRCGLWRAVYGHSHEKIRIK